VGGDETMTVAEPLAEPTLAVMLALPALWPTT